MPDEELNDTHADKTNEPEDATTGDDEASSGAEQGPEPADEPEEAATDDLGEAEQDTAERLLHRRIANRANMQQLGTLYVYTEARTFTLPLDGDAAMRLLAAYRFPSTRAEMGDLLAPAVSSAASAWAVVDYSKVLGLFWLPGLPSEENLRIAVDPAAA